MAKAGLKPGEFVMGLVKGIGDKRVKPGAAAIHHDFERLIVRHFRLVAAGIDEGIIHIHHRKYPGCQGNIAASQSVRVA